MDLLKPQQPAAQAPQTAPAPLPLPNIGQTQAPAQNAYQPPPMQQQTQAPAQNAYQPPPMQQQQQAPAFSDPFAGIGSAQPTDRSPAAPTGLDCVVEVLRCEAVTAPRQGFGYIVHYKIVECAGNPDLVNQEYAWKNWAKNPQPFKTACAGFVKAIFALTNSAQHTQVLQTQATEVVKASFSEAQVFKGRRVRLQTHATTTDRGFAFNRHDWSAAPGVLPPA